MNNNIICYIASNLQISLPSDIKNLTILKINSNDNIVPNHFAILILNKETHLLYSESRFRSEDNFDAVAYYNIDNNSPHDIIEMCEVFDYLLSHPGMLSHYQILTLMKLGILIYNGDGSRVRGASYDLLIDREHLKSGVQVTSSDIFKIDPLDYVIVGAVESVNIPRNICASFDTKVSMFCRGIILSNGPQVDPGYQGRILCLLFNTSAKEFEISPVTDFEFSTIQFYSLSIPTDTPYTGRYLRKERLRDYIGSFADESISALVTSIPEMRRTITDLNQAVHRLRRRRFSLSQLIGTIIVGLLLGGFSAAFFLGGFNTTIKDHEKRIKKLENKEISIDETKTKDSSIKASKLKSHFNNLDSLKNLKIE